jgi:outer membrane immunogenic protein
MKKLLIAGIAAAALSGASALAADLPTKAPAYTAAPTPMFNWSGFYVGGNIGGAWGHEVGSTIFTTPLALAGTQTPGNVSGFLGGVQAGFNYQLDPHWLVGIEGDWSWTDTKGSTSTPGLIINPPSTLGGSTDIRWFATLTGRLGYIWDGWLYFAKAGGAWLNADYSATGSAGPFFEAASLSVNRSGWTVGAGIERMLDKNWTAKLEYDYLNFGTDRILFTFPGVGSNGANTKTYVNIIKFGVNYKFGDWGKAPVVSAKY